MIWDYLFKYRGGDLYWKVKPTKNRKAGEVVTGKAVNGYLRVGYGGRRYFAHRVIWELFNGEIPEGSQIDHINGIRDDNRIDNLRLATNEQNSWNKLGVKGYYWDKSRSKFHAQICVDKGVVFLGYHSTKEAARTAYQAACLLYRGVTYVPE